MAQVKLSVSVKDSSLSEFDEVVKRVKKAGMKVEHELKTSGIITGEVDEKKVKKLHNVSGVSNVEEQETYQIAPPDSDVQ